MNHSISKVARAVLLLLLVAAVACGRISIRHERAPEADLSGLLTYAWVPDPDLLSLHPLTRTEELNSRLMASIDRELAARGYEKASTGAIDFRVRYAAYFVDQFSTKHRFDIPVNAANQRNNYWGPWGTNLHTYNADYKQGSLVVGILPPDSEGWLWRGVAEGVVQESLSKADRWRRIDTALRDILAGFPPRQ